MKKSNVERYNEMVEKLKSLGEIFEVVQNESEITIQDVRYLEDLYLEKQEK